MTEHTIISRILCVLGAHVWEKPFNYQTTNVYGWQNDTRPIKIFEFCDIRCKLCGKVKTLRSKR